MLLKNTSRIFFGLLILGQTTLVAQAPSKVSASDGTFENYVLIRWAPPAESKAFKVYRSKQQPSQEKEEISNTTQKSSWFYDYKVERGEKYEYSIVAIYDEDTSNPSTPDLGFPKPPRPVAFEESELESSLLAMADPSDFESNDFFNPLLSSSRNTDYPFEITKPQPNALFQPNVNLQIEIEGNLNKAQLAASEVLSLQVYSNLPDDFNNGTPILQTAIRFQPNGNGFAFKEQFPFPYPKGLYYYVIALEADGDPLFVEQFRVGEP